MSSQEKKENIDDLQNLLDILRNAHLSLKEYVTQYQTDLKTSWYIPNVILLEDPEKQKMFRTKYISSIYAIPDPTLLYLDAHELQRRLIEAITWRSDSSEVRKELGEFFKRRVSNLQHMKYNLLVRWVHHVQVSY